MAARALRGFGIGLSWLAFGLIMFIIGGWLVGVATAFGTTDAGEVGVVRNGGWFDDNQIRRVIGSGSGPTWVGLYSTVHKYPAQQRFYTMTSDPERGGRPGIDVAHAPSSDGVEMGIEATIYFNVNTDEATLKLLDEKFGTRQFLGADGELRYPWDGVDGWNTFWDAAVRPIVEKSLRLELAKFTCTQLVSSCALLQTPGRPAGPPADGATSNSAYAQIQEAINKGLPAELRENLGGEFFQNFKFNLVRVTLPAPVEEAVVRAQAAAAAVSEAQAKVAQARAEAEANTQRQQGYNACPACAQIDMIKALPPGVTTYAPGGGPLAVK